MSAARTDQLRTTVLQLVGMGLNDAQIANQAGGITKAEVVSIIAVHRSQRSFAGPRHVLAVSLWGMLTPGQQAELYQTGQEALDRLGELDRKDLVEFLEALRASGKQAHEYISDSPHSFSARRLGLLLNRMRAPDVRMPIRVAWAMVRYVATQQVAAVAVAEEAVAED